MSGLLDVALIVLLLAYLVYGYRLGLIRSLGALVGIALGAVAAALLGPPIGALSKDATVRVIATIVVSCVLILLGHGIGAAIGAAIGRRVQRGPLGLADRILGGAINLVVAAFVVSVVATGIAALGVPFLAQPIASSRVLGTIEAVTPPQVATALAQLRTTMLPGGLPVLNQTLGGPTTSPSPPSVQTGTASLRTAASSVVKVTGTAYACGQDQSGSGFVIAAHRVLTNAHVLTGVSRPVVLDRDGDVHLGTVVWFDGRHDLAVVAVPSLDAPALTVASDPAPGDSGVVDGYPFGGPFHTGSAGVVSSAPTPVRDIVGSGTTIRQVVTLAADVEQGNSGGPLLTPAGTVAGIVFARSATTDGVGYAMAPQDFRPVVEDAPTLQRAVSTGACRRD
ncbi:MarP family serine protease [uncultured Amnibacterium sp.]|uniref:MarP family serine protease n=1 Tax=uncultured Amnibacterium sp. TaxID=1631851 RepID=UPI0035CC5340